jgi:hypothetical protein
VGEFSFRGWRFSVGFPAGYGLRYDRAILTRGKEVVGM